MRDVIEVEQPTSFSGTQVCRDAGITYRQLDYWCRTDLVRPSICDAAGSGTQRAYSESDVRRLRAIKQLLDAGLSLQSIREIADALAFEDGDTGYLVVGDGRANLVQTGDALMRELLDRERVVHVLRID